MSSMSDCASNQQINEDESGSLYGLTESEFIHILSTFPLVSDETKSATLAAFRNQIEK